MSFYDSDVVMGGTSDDEMTRAAEQAKSWLQKFTSPKTYVRPSSLEGDSREWLRQTTEPEYPEEDVESIEVDEEIDDEPATFPALAGLAAATPPKRQARLERSNTPVISNQSKKLKHTPKSASSTATSEFQSPLSSPYPGLASPSSLSIIQRSVPSSTSSHVEYQRFWEATLIFVNAKRQHLERQARQPQADDHIRDCRIEIEFLQALQRTCWDVGNASHEKQGNFWLLLSTLRKLGPEFLLWDDSKDSKKRRRSELEAFKEKLAAHVAEHPKAVLDYLKDDDVPSYIRRLTAIIRWLEGCFNHSLPSGVTRPRQVRYLEDSALLKLQGLPETDKDGELFECSLALLLAGRMSDAQKLWKDSGVPWRAIVFTGEEPLGYQYVSDPVTQKVEYQVTGNERRPLWRRFQWLKAQKMAEKEIKTCNDDQSAIHAILGCNVVAAMQNSSLRSWEKGLYATFRAVLGRLEDEILSRHNNARRADGPYPGTQFEKSENEHLAATKDYANFDEQQVIDMLKTSPYPQMHSNDPVSLMTAMILAGESTVADFLKECTTKIESGDLSDESFVRFFVHLLLYLDILVEAPPPYILSDVHDLKNRAIRCYLQTLGSREDLWYLRVLYASRLPLDELPQSLTPLLLPIERHEERKAVVEQLRDYLPVSGLDVDLLRLIVGSILSSDSLADIDPDTPTPLDLKKMDSIKWLSFSSVQLGIALEYTNTLLRQFFLSDKLASAELFVEDILRGKDSLERKMLEAVAGSDMDTDEKASHLLPDSKAEYEAYLVYLTAQKDYRVWKDLVASADTSPNVVDDQVDPSRLDAVSAPIARQMQQRQLIREKRAVSYKLKAVAQAALASLEAVLKCPGGWLLVGDNATSRGADAMVVVDDESGRRSECSELRRKILPSVVLSYYELCIETAAWMSRSLNDAVERLDGESHLSVLMNLDDSMDPSSPGESALAPWFWTSLAMNLADLVVSETYDILPACDVVSLKEFVEKAEDVAVQHLMYESTRK